MFNFLKSEIYFRKSRYLLYLSSYSGENIPRYIWALYNLGKYRSVILSTPKFVKNEEILIAFAASHAACGDLDSSIYFSQKFEKYYSHRIEKLIIALLPFNASLALQYAEKYQRKNLLLVVLYLNQNHIDKAEKLFKAIDVNNKNLQDYYLAKSLLYSDNIEENLTSLNHVMKHFRLSELQLKSYSKNLSINNIFSSSMQSSCTYQGLVSILMTCYNAEKYLKSSLESLLNQSYPYFEIIIVDDCSTDETWSILQEYTKKDARIHLCKQSINSGTYVAKNRALLLAKGDYVMCHDADDWSHPERLAHQLKPFLSNSNLICTTSNWIRIDDEGQLYARSIFPLARLNPSSPLFKRQPVMEKLGGWDSVRIGADTEFLRRLELQFGYNAVYKVKIPLSFGAHHQSSLMNNSITGFISQSMPDVRLTYWESWSNWHIECQKNSSSLYIKPFALSKERSYSAPESILIADDILLSYKLLLN